MSLAPAQDHAEQLQTSVPADYAAAPSRWRAIRVHFRKMPLWTRYGAISVLLIAIIFAVYAAIPVEQAHLQIICQHSFRSAQLSVLVDGSLVYTSNINVTPKRRLGILSKGQSGPEVFSKLIDVPTGRHVVQAHISAPDEGFDQARSAAADFASDRESILQINATRRNTLAVNFDGATTSAVATTASSAPDSHPLPRNGITIVFSILGTMLSASVSFLVQEFWRSHKNRVSS
ncbi:MAG TPA: hypothetical protein VHV32_15420 [Candidatus Angelobacter sp.]|nr:hypothetical protein [Candidatus Angelobacter sp.]